MIKVVNLNEESYDIYIGRPDMANRNSFEHYGNPYSQLDLKDTIKVNSTKEAIDSYKNWLIGLIDTDKNQEQRTWILDNLAALMNKKIGCFCKPKACHGDILKELAEMYRM
jgi:hypothetical protein